MLLTAYAMLVKVFGVASDNEGQRRYSPAECTRAGIHHVSGAPEVKHISTSYVERQNLTMRISMRRFTRLTIGFSKKIENHYFAMALYFLYTTSAGFINIAGYTGNVDKGCRPRLELGGNS